MIPKYFFLTKGVGKHKEQLQSFELALRNAGIQYCNLVNVSSIVPPECKMVSREQGLKMVQPGEITFVVRAAPFSRLIHRRSHPISQEPVRLPFRAPLSWANRRSGWRLRGRLGRNHACNNHGHPIWPWNRLGREKAAFQNQRINNQNGQHNSVSSRRQKRLMDNHDCSGSFCATRKRHPLENKKITSSLLQCTFSISKRSFAV